jgi:hypothetical protein
MAARDAGGSARGRLLHHGVGHDRSGSSRSRRGIETKLVVGATVGVPDAAQIGALHASHCERTGRKAGGRKPGAAAATICSPARRRSYLAFLSPRIQRAILNGTSPEGLTLERLLASDLPIDWAAQERMLGFVGNAAKAGD